MAIKTENLDCDYYRFLRSDPNAINEYMGEYMKQYSWAEMRIHELDNEKNGGW